MRAYKFARVASAEWVVQSGQGECPMLISPVQGGSKTCPACAVDYKPLAYTLGQVEAHHWHPGQGGSGIYHFNLTDQRPYVDLASSKRDLMSSESLRFETSWLMDLECSEDCTGRPNIGQVYGSRRFDQNIVQSSSVTVKAVYPVCHYCHLDVPIGRMVELRQDNYQSQLQLAAVCEVCIQRYGHTAYWIMYDSMSHETKGWPLFIPVVDKAEAPTALSGIVTVTGDVDPTELVDLKRRGYLPDDWMPGGMVTRFQAKHLGEFRDWDTTVRGDFYRTIELQQRKSQVIHEVTIEQMSTAQGQRRSMREWEQRLADVEVKMKAAMNGELT